MSGQSTSRSVWAALLAAAVFITCVAVLGGAIGPFDAAAKSARYARFDVLLELEDDGTLHVTETQSVSFDDGPFTYGFRTIPLARVDAIESIAVYELVDGRREPFVRVPFGDVEDEPGQFGVSERATEIEVGWKFSEAFDETRTFVVEYDAIGALRVYPNADPPNQQIWWTALGSDLTSTTPVDESMVELRLPEAAPLDEIVVQTNDSTVMDNVTDHTLDGQVFTWEGSRFSGGDEFIVRVQFPPIVEGVAPPAWQETDDAQRVRAEESESREAFLHVMLAAAGGLLLVLGGVSAYGMWYARGRDPHTGLVAEFASVPPDDVGPGIVGALLDESADDPDIVATLLDLARSGVITMTEPGTGAKDAAARGNDYVFELAKVPASLPAHERRMLSVMFGERPKTGDAVALGTVIPRIRAQYDLFRSDLYAELVQHGYFTQSPETTRTRWKRGANGAIIAGGAVGVVGAIVFDAWAFIPAAAIVVVGLVYWRMSPRMPKKTPAGAEAAARWRAFRTYLKDIERYEKLDESKAIFDRYLPYAVAFGIDQEWMRKFSRVDTPTPPWFNGGDVIVVGNPWGHGHPGGGTYHGGGGGSSGGGLDLPDVDLPDLDLPDMQKGSDAAGRALSGGSNAALALLGKAVLEIAVAIAAGGIKGGGGGGGGGGFR